MYSTIEPINLSDLGKTDESLVGLFAFVIVVQYCIG